MKLVFEIFLEEYSADFLIILYGQELHGNLKKDTMN